MHIFVTASKKRMLTSRGVTLSNFVLRSAPNQERKFTVTVTVRINIKSLRNHVLHPRFNQISELNQDYDESNNTTSTNNYHWHAVNLNTGK